MTVSLRGTKCGEARNVERAAPALPLTVLLVRARRYTSHHVLDEAGGVEAALPAPVPMKVARSRPTPDLHF